MISQTWHLGEAELHLPQMGSGLRRGAEMITGNGILPVQVNGGALATLSFTGPLRVEPVTLTMPHVTRQPDDISPIGVETAEIYRITKAVKLPAGLRHRVPFAHFTPPRRDGPSLFSQMRKQVPYRIRQNRVRADLDEDLMTAPAESSRRLGELDRFTQIAPPVAGVEKHSI